MTAFDEIQFPTTISAGASGGPAFKTDIVTVNDGFERRNQNWSQGRIHYDASYGVRSLADAATIIKFFRARQGMVRGFRFRDPLDYTSAADGISNYSAIDQLVGIGNSSQTQFQLVKNYTSGGITQSRNIKKPVSGKILIAVDGYTQKSGSWTGRSSTALYINSSGLLATAAIDAPRWSHDPITLSPVGLLIEGAKTNYINNSNGAAGWSETAAVLNLAVATSPDGSTNAAELVDNATSSGHYTAETSTITFTSGNTYTQSFYLKASTASIAQITFTSSGFSTLPYANFNLATGQVTQYANCTAGIQAAGNGWYRCYITAVATTTTGSTTGCILGLVNDNPTAVRLPTYVGSSNKIQMYGAQTEDGSLSSLIPSTGSDASRAADITTWAAGTLYEEALFPMTVDSTTGIITFTTAPTTGLEIRAGYEFDVPARFDADDLDVRLIHYKSGQLSIPIKEILI